MCSAGKHAFYWCNRNKCAARCACAILSTRLFHNFAFAGLASAVKFQYMKGKNSTHYENPYLQSCQTGEVNISIVGEPKRN